MRPSFNDLLGQTLLKKCFFKKKVIFLIDAIKPNVENKKYAQIDIQNLRKRKNTIII